MLRMHNYPKPERLVQMCIELFVHTCTDRYRWSEKVCKGTSGGYDQGYICKYVYLWYDGAGVNVHNF